MNHVGKPTFDERDMEAIKRYCYGHGVGIGGVLLDLGCGKAVLIGNRVVYGKRERKVA